MAQRRWLLVPSLALLAGCSGDADSPPRDHGPASIDAASSSVDARAPLPEEVRPPPDAAPRPAPPSSAADAAPGPPVDAGAPAEAGRPPPDAAAAVDFTCNLVIGIKATGEWFNAGFESVVENARWEVISVHNGHLELWADPKNSLWSLEPSSPCAKNAKAPDRVVFVGTNYDYTTTEEFVPKLVAVVQNLQARYPSLARIELQTYVRAPGNTPCPGDLSIKTYIKAAQDESNALVARMFPGLVFVSPKFEVRACSDYSMPPHFTPAAAMAAAKSIGAHYLQH